MPRLSKYDTLKRWLQACDRPSVTLTFAELADILGFDLPESALKYDSWWANSATGGSQIRAWRDAGWEVAEVDRAGRRVTFRRVRGAPVRSVRRPADGIRIVTTADTLSPSRGKQGADAPNSSPAAGDGAPAAPEMTGPGQPASFDRQAREMAEGAMQGEMTGIRLPADLVDAGKLPPQARRLLEMRARRHGRALVHEIAAIVSAAVTAEKQLLLDELRRLRETTERPGSFDILALLGRRT